MKRVVRWIVAGAAGALLLVAAAGTGVAVWLRTDDFRARLEQQLATRVGVPLALGRLGVEGWPEPELVVENLRIGSTPPVTVERVAARPRWSALLRGELEILTLEVRGVEVPPAVLGDLLDTLLVWLARGEAGTSAAASARTAWLVALPRPRQVALQRVSWRGLRERRSTADIVVDFDAEGWAQGAHLDIVAGPLAGARGRLSRQPEAGTWRVDLQLGGGRVHGSVHAGQAADGLLRLAGGLKTEGVEVSALLAPVRTVVGRMDADTQLSAEFRRPVQLVQALRTQSRFTIHDAKVRGVDLVLAVMSGRPSALGETRVKAITGVSNTQGLTVDVSGLQIEAPAFHGKGELRLESDLRLVGRLRMHLAGPAGLLTAPLDVSGTLDAPRVAVAGASVVGVTANAAATLGRVVTAPVRRLQGAAGR